MIFLTVIIILHINIALNYKHRQRHSFDIINRILIFYVEIFLYIVNYVKLDLYVFLIIELFENA